MNIEDMESDIEWLKRRVRILEKIADYEDWNEAEDQVDQEIRDEADEE